MKLQDKSEPELIFSVHAVEDQLEKIFRDPRFAESEILKKFLSFIVQETILGRANCLKEYTIAINVLQRSHNFSPREDCIVRIHAGRLRRALCHYYNVTGNNDQIIITIPKGKYVPVFINRCTMDVSFHDDELNGTGLKKEEDRRIVLAVLPFIYATKNNSVKSFTEGLCLQLSSVLTRLNLVSVIAYQALKNLDVSLPDYRENDTALKFNYIISGGVQCFKNTVRINIQLIECNSYHLKWSETFERQLTKSNFLEIEDEICKRVIDQIETHTNKGFRFNKPLPVAL